MVSNRRAAVDGFEVDMSLCEASRNVDAMIDKTLQQSRLVGHRAAALQYLRTNTAFEVVRLASA